MITDLSYQIDNVDAGKRFLAQLCNVYKEFYAV